MQEPTFSEPIFSPPDVRRPLPQTGWSARAIDCWHRRREEPILGVVALVVVALIAGTFWYRAGVAGAGGSGGAKSSANKGNVRLEDSNSETGSKAGTGTGGTGSSEGGGSEGETGDASGDVIIHVAGAVARPGVYELDTGNRITDAIDAAGGPIPEADLHRLNLAAKVADGQRIVVPRQGQQGEPTATGEGGAGGTNGDTTGQGAGQGEASPGRINLNTATQAQLEMLPGIGPSFARSILSYRERKGSFRSVRELLEVRGIGEARFAELKDLVTV